MGAEWDGGVERQRTEWGEGVVSVGMYYVGVGGSSLEEHGVWTKCSGLESKHAGFKHAEHIYRETEKPTTEDKLCWLLLQGYLFNLY